MYDFKRFMGLSLKYSDESLIRRKIPYTSDGRKGIFRGGASRESVSSPPVFEKMVGVNSRQHSSAGVKSRLKSRPRSVGLLR